MKIWFINHYAVPPQYYPLSRPSLLAMNLIKNGHEVTIICASTAHNTDVNLINGKRQYKRETVDGIPYIYIKCSPYKGNGVRRIINIIEFAMKLPFICNKIEKPDVILATSFDPLSCYQAVRYAKKNRIKVVAEIADLWPETLIAYGAATENNPIVKILRIIEKRIYTKADAIVFTMEGAYDYIISQGWETLVPKRKVAFINNGVDLDLFNYNSRNYSIDDADLNNSDLFKVVYTGSIGKSNRIDLLVDAAKYIKNDHIKILIWGSGDELDNLKEKVNRESIKGVVFKGRVQKKEIPFILQHADATFLDVFDEKVSKYGISSNKLFEYLAAGKPIMMCRISGNNPADNYNCSITYESTPKGVAMAIDKAYNLSYDESQTIKEEAIKAANDYSYEKLSQKLLNVFQKL